MAAQGSPPPPHPLPVVGSGMLSGDVYFWPLRGRMKRACASLFNRLHTVCFV